jgi:hypothetical protein
MQAGRRSALRLTITIIRRHPRADGSGRGGERGGDRNEPDDLPNTPQRGDVVEAWGAQFTVTTVRQPDPYGMVHLTLTMQPPSQ